MGLAAPLLNAYRLLVAYFSVRFLHFMYNIRWAMGMLQDRYNYLLSNFAPPLCFGARYIM